MNLVNSQLNTRRKSKNWFGFDSNFFFCSFTLTFTILLKTEHKLINKFLIYFILCFDTRSPATIQKQFTWIFENDKPQKKHQ